MNKLEEYGPGPWCDEPDRVEFEAHGLPCLLRRNDLGAWCGYAAVPPGHPLHGQRYDCPDLDAHGGITFAGPCHGEICHVPRPGQPDNVWWFGFDCAHCFDLVPGMEKLLKESREQLGLSGHRFRSEYRDLAYVTEQTESLAEQLAAHCRPLNSISCEDD
jgi:hypothetical protein